MSKVKTVNTRAFTPASTVMNSWRAYFGDDVADNFNRQIRRHNGTGRPLESEGEVGKVPLLAGDDVGKK